MAGNFFDKRQVNIDPWGRGNNQNERFETWMGPEDRGGPMRREPMDLERSRNQMGMRREELTNPMQSDWYEDEEFQDARFRNDGRATGNFTGQEMRSVRRGPKRPKTQQSYDDMADSVFQSEQMKRQEASQIRAREKEYTRDGNSAPFTGTIWDRPDTVREEYYHKQPNSMPDRNPVRYEEPQGRPTPNYNFDFTDKASTSAPAAPAQPIWNKPVPAGAENSVLSPPKKKKKKKDFSPSWNMPSGSSAAYDADYSRADPGGESLYTRRPRRPDEMEARPRPVTNMDVYRVRMAVEAEKQKCKEEPEHSVEKRTYSVDSDEYLYQEKPAPQRPPDERKDPFWENLNKRSEKEREGVEAKNKTSIGDVLVETLLKHISQKVDSSAQKESGKSVDLAQQLMNMLSGASADSRPAEEPKVLPKEPHKVERPDYEVRPPQTEPAKDFRMYPANPEPVPPVNPAPGFSATPGYYPGQQYSYGPPPVSQPDYSYAQGSMPQMIAPVMHHPMAPQPVPPPMSPFLPRPQIQPMFPSFSPMTSSPAQLASRAAMRFPGLSVPDKPKASRWSVSQANNAQRRPILTPIPKKVEARIDKTLLSTSEIARKNPIPAARPLSTFSATSKSFPSLAYRSGFDKSRPLSAKPTGSSAKHSASSAKAAWKATTSASRDVSSASREVLSTSRDGGSASKDNGSAKNGSYASKDPMASKTGSSSSKDSKSAKDAGASSRSAKPSRSEPCPVPKTSEERKILVEQEVQLKKKVELLRTELNRLKSKCASRMSSLHFHERFTDPKLKEARKLQGEIKTHVDNANDELLSVRNALRASQHLEESAPKKASALAPDRKGSSEKSKPIVLNLKSPGAPQAAGAEVKVLETPAAKHYRFTDNGDHWCKHCDIVMPVADDLLKHLQRKHYAVMQHIPAGERPWAEKPAETKPGPGEKFTCLPFRGVEFMIPTDSFFCNLCKELFGDLSAARSHLESLKHNANYSKFCKSNPNYAKHIQSVLNAQKKTEKKASDSPEVTSEEHSDIKVLPTEVKKDEPEIIDIDDDDADAGTGGKQSTKSKAAPESEDSTTVQAEKSEQASSNCDKAQKDDEGKGTGKDATGKPCTKTGGTESERASNLKAGAPDKKKNNNNNDNSNRPKPIPSKATIKNRIRKRNWNKKRNNRPNTENVFEKVSDDELIVDPHQESSGAQVRGKDSSKNLQNENVFDKISDDEMVDETPNDFEMITDDEVIDEVFSGKSSADAVEHASEDVAKNDENAAENVTKGEEDLADFGEDTVIDDADITILDDVDADNANETSAAILIEDANDDKAAEEKDGEDNASKEVELDEKDTTDNAGEGEDNPSIVDEHAEDVVIDEADKEANITDGGAEDEVGEDFAAAEDEVADEAGEEEIVEIVDEAGEDEVVDEDGEDEVVDEVGEEEEVVDEVGEDDVVEDAGEVAEEDELGDAVAKDDDEVAGVAAKENEITDVAADDAAAEEDEVVDVAPDEEEVMDVEAEEEEVADVAAEDEEVADVAAEDEEVADVVAEDEEVADVAAEDEEAADVAAEDEEAADVAAEDEEAADVAAEDEEAADVAAEDEEVEDVAPEEDEAANAAAEEEVTDVAAEEEEGAAVVVEKDEAGAEENVVAHLAAEEDKVADAPVEDNMASTASNIDSETTTQIEAADNASEGKSRVNDGAAIAAGEDVAQDSTMEITGIIGAGDVVEKDASNTATVGSADGKLQSPAKGTTEILAESSGGMAERTKTLVKGDYDPKVLDSSSENPTSEPQMESSEVKEKQGSPPTKRRQMAICSRGRGRGAARGRGRADPPKVTQREISVPGTAEDEDAAPEPAKKVTLSKYTRGARVGTPTSTRVGTRSSRQAVVAVEKIPEKEVPPKPRRQPPRAVGVKRDQGGRPVRGKTAAEEDVIDLESPEQSADPPGQASTKRCRSKITPKRNQLAAEIKVVQKAQDAVKENPKPAAGTQDVVQDEEEAKKSNLLAAASSGTEAESQRVVETEEMETSALLEGGDGSNLVDLSVEEEDNANLENMEAILLGDPFANSSEMEEADDACLESDLEVVDEAEDTD